MLADLAVLLASCVPVLGELDTLLNRQGRTNCTM